MVGLTAPGHLTHLLLPGLRKRNHKSIKYDVKLVVKGLQVSKKLNNIEFCQGVPPLA